MNCPRCDHNISRVLATRRDTVETVMRRRRCEGCGHCWYTCEVEVPSDGVRYHRDRETGESGWMLRRVPGYKRIKVLFF